MLENPLMLIDSIVSKIYDKLKGNNEEISESQKTHIKEALLSRIREQLVNGKVPGLLTFNMEFQWIKNDNSTQVQLNHVQNRVVKEENALTFSFDPAKMKADGMIQAAKDLGETVMPIVPTLKAGVAATKTIVSAGILVLGSSAQSRVLNSSPASHIMQFVQDAGRANFSFKPNIFTPEHKNDYYKIACMHFGSYLTTFMKEIQEDLNSTEPSKYSQGAAAKERGPEDAVQVWKENFEIKAADIDYLNQMELHLKNEANSKKNDDPTARLNYLLSNERGLSILNLYFQQLKFLEICNHYRRRHPNEPLWNTPANRRMKEMGPVGELRHRQSSAFDALLAQKAPPQLKEEEPQKFQLMKKTRLPLILFSEPSEEQTGENKEVQSIPNSSILSGESTFLCSQEELLSPQRV